MSRRLKHGRIGREAAEGAGGRECAPEEAAGATFNGKCTIAALTEATGLTTPTVTQALRELERLGIVRETTGKARGRVFAYARYLDALNAENESAA